MRAKQWMARLAATALAGVMAAALTSCGSGEKFQVVNGPWPDVVASAKREGHVSLYTSLTPTQNQRLVAAFDKAYPEIQVNVTRGTAELTPRVEKEIQSGAPGADIFAEAAAGWFIDHQGDLLDINGPAVDGWNADSWVVPGKVVVPSIYPHTMFIWNTKLVPNGIRSWQDFLAPNLADKIGFRTQMTPTYAGLFTFMKDKLGPEYLEAFSKQRLKFYDSVVPLTQAVASGEVSAAPISVPATVKDLQGQGAPIADRLPDVGYGVPWAAGALKKSPYPNAARVFFDFMMSPEGQTALNGDGYGVAGRPGIAGALQLPGFTILDAPAFTAERMAEVGKESDTYFR